jgi:8-oxo-dGTP pyrophosphatase MutT (NUDIX family)
MSPIPSPPPIRIAAALLCGPDGRTLLARKRGTSFFMQPGGKIEPNEAPLEALARELAEELGLTIDPASAVHLGRLLAPAANEPNRAVEAELFRLDIAGDVAPAAEIEEVVWVDPRSPDGIELAPLTALHVLPLCGSHGRWRSSLT